MTGQAENPEAANDEGQILPMTDKAVKILESFAKQSLTNLVDVAGMMPRGQEYQAMLVAQKVIAKVCAVWFGLGDEEVYHQLVEAGRGQFGEVTVMSPDKLAEWKTAVLEEVAAQRFKREKGASPRIIVPEGKFVGH